MTHIQGQNRNQITLFPESIDDYISEENVVRVVDAFVDRLNMVELGFRYAEVKETGRPPYNPGDLLKLYLYGYMNRVRSSRRLERESQRNVEVMWLLKRLTPDFKTIADFRKDNRGGIRQVLMVLIQLLRGAGLIDGGTVAVDGSKFKAVNSVDRCFSHKKLTKKIAELEQKIEAYLTELDEVDAEETEEESDTRRKRVSEVVAGIKARQAYYERMLKQLKATGEKQIALTDSDARMMAGKSKGNVVGYNVQLAVESKHKLIVANDVVNEANDKQQLQPMAAQAKANTGVVQMEVVADTGYFTPRQIKKCDDQAITAYVPYMDGSSSKHRGLYSKSDFCYDAVSDSYRCPAGNVMEYKFTSTTQGYDYKYYRTPACQTCSSRSRCTTNKTGERYIMRWVHEELIEERSKDKQVLLEKMRLRKALAEHPFGTIKRQMDQGFFLMKGLKKVKTEMNLTVLAYNFKRVLNILGANEMKLIFCP